MVLARARYEDGAGNTIFSLIWMR